MKRALIFGRSRGVWEDMARAQALGDYDLIIGVGSTGVDYPGKMDVWISFHAVFFDHWSQKRAAKGYPPCQEYWSSTHRGRPVPSRMPAPDSKIEVRYYYFQGGSSGLVATAIALDPLGCDRVVLAGIPMDPEAGQYDTDQPWTEALKHRQFWERDKDKLLGKVKSMSGWTREFLGEPTREWLSDNVYA